MKIRDGRQQMVDVGKSRRSATEVLKEDVKEATPAALTTVADLVDTEARTEARTAPADTVQVVVMHR